MACGGCAKRQAAKSSKAINVENGVMGGYAYLTDRQIRARLEVYKKRYCRNCNNRYQCDYKMYVACKKNK